MAQRWYDPRMGRWTAEDPSGFAAGDPNLYRYVGNSPLNYTDPTGKSQAGNPLNNLAKSLANSRTPLFTQPRPSASNAKLSAGTLGSAVGNSVLSAAPTVVSPGTRAAISTGVLIASAANSLVLPDGGANREQGFFDVVNPFGLYYSGTSGISKHGQLDQQIRAIQEKEVQKKTGFDQIDALQNLNQGRAANISRDAEQLAKTGVYANSVILGGTFVRPSTTATGPTTKPIDASRAQHGTPPHDATSFNTAKAWSGERATLDVRFNQQLVDTSGNAIPMFRPDAQRIRVTPSGKKVVDVVEVQSPGQSDAFMNAKVEQIRKSLGNQAGTIRWIPPQAGAKR